MSILSPRRSILASSAILAACILTAGTAGASNRGAPDIDALLRQMSSDAMGAPQTSQQSSASAWSESGGDHGISVTTTTSGNTTTCMAVEWKRENGGDIKKWQYRCDAGQRP